MWVATLIIQVPVYAAPSTLTLDAENSQIIFYGRSNTHGFKGISHDLQGTMRADLETRTLTDPFVIHIPVQGFVTGNVSRDHAMQHLFEMEKYPDILLRVDRISAVQNDRRLQGTYHIEGTITIHNISQPITLAAEAIFNGDTVTVTGEQEILMDLYGLKPPSMLKLFTVKKEIKVVFDTHWKVSS